MSDDPFKLFVYIYNNYAHLLTKEERLAYGVRVALRSASSWSQAEREALVLRLGGGSKEVGFLLAQGEEEFFRNVAERIVTEHGGVVDLVRCKRCSVLCASPRSKQCLNCGLDWH